MILSAELAPGSRLTEGEIALRLGVSRGPVREAFRGMEQAGLLRFRKNFGVFVRELSLEEAEQIYEVRAVLEAFSARRLAADPSPKAVSQLLLRVRRLEAAAAAGDTNAYSVANHAFHDRLVALAGSARLLEMYRGLVSELRLYRRSALELNDDLASSSRQHRKIVELIEAGDAEAAGNALYEHVTEGMKRMRRESGRAAPG